MDGRDKFLDGTTPLDYELQDFWKWYASNLLHGPLRGALAEYIVARSLGMNPEYRGLWDAYDISYNGHSIEVKSSAYLQEKEHLHLTKRLKFDIGTHTHNSEKKRHAELYVFCLYHCEDLESHNPLQLKDWTFYVVPTIDIERELGNAKQVSFIALTTRLQPVVATYNTLKESVDRVCEKITT